MPTSAGTAVERAAMRLDYIHLGNAADLLGSLPDESIDLVVSSPPYNLGKEYEARKALNHYLEDQVKILTECIRCLKPSGSIFWQVGAFSDRGILIPLDIKFFGILELLGMQPRNRIVWIRQHGLHGQRKFSCRHETILWFTKSDEYKFYLDEIRVPQKYQNKKSYRGETKGSLSCNPNGKNPGDVWVFRNVKHNHEEQTIHPCQFPEDLVARIVLSVTEPEDVVLDPYMGAGTTAVVARQYGRRYVGAELEPKYYDVILRRLSGEPDAHGRFPNLKTLRNYVDRTGERIEKFRFDVQVGQSATDREKARIYPEEHHFEGLVERLSFEEACFSADIRGEPRPPDPLVHNRKVYETSKAEQHGTLSLFGEDAEQDA